MRSKRILTMLAALMLCVAGCGTEVQIATPEPAKVTVMHPIERELTDYEEFNGWMAPQEKVEVRARVRGHIQKVHFTDGQTVTKGELLFELDPRPFEAMLQQAKDALRVFEAQKVAAENDAIRLRNLQIKGAVSIQEAEKAEADAQALAASIDTAKSEIRKAELDLEYSKITADIDGRVGKAELTEGNLVNAGGSDPLLTTIMSIDPIRLYFNVDERSLRRYAQNVGATGRNFTELLANMKDQKAEFTFVLDGEDDFSHKGTMRFGDNHVDPSTGTMLVYGTASNKDGAFVPGARVRVRLQIGKPYIATLVPETAILADQSKRYVLIVDDQKTVRRRDVTLGALTDDGLRAVVPADKLANAEKPQDWWVITDNLQRARVNYPVDPQMPSVAVAAR